LSFFIAEITKPGNWHYSTYIKVRWNLSDALGSLSVALGSLSVAKILTVLDLAAVVDVVREFKCDTCPNSGPGRASD
jgi:hypothetical protein